MAHVLLHQGIGLDAFNALPERKAVHALYECCNSVTMAARPGPRPRRTTTTTQLFRRADALLFALSEDVGRPDPARPAPTSAGGPRSAKSQAEQCAVWDDDAAR